MADKCTLYRLREKHHENIHTPDKCKKCFAVCKNPALPGTTWCQECIDAAMGSGNPLVMCWANNLTKAPQEGTTILTLLGQRR